MRLPGRIAPGSGVGEAGHFAAFRLPNATAEAKVSESCLVRPGRRCGFAESGPEATGACGAVATRAAAESGVATECAAFPESVPFPSGTVADPGVVSWPAQAMSAVNTDRTAERYRKDS